MEAPLVSGIAFDKNEALIKVKHIPHKPGMAYRVLELVSAQNIEVDMIVQNDSQEGFTDLTFTVPKAEMHNVLEIIENASDDLENVEVRGDDTIVKLSIVGIGMQSHAGVATKMFKVLSDENINIMLISTSEIKISTVIEEKYLELAVRALHDGFELDK